MGDVTAALFADTREPMIAVDNDNLSLCCFNVGQSLSHLLVHSVFSTKKRRPFLRPGDIRNEIYAYMAGILKNLESPPIKIGGMEDHIHILLAQSKNIAFSELIGRLKGSSSKRLKEKGIHGFSWQNGYGAFSVSESNVEAVVAYIDNQAEHALVEPRIVMTPSDLQNAGLDELGKKWG